MTLENLLEMASSTAGKLGQRTAYLRRNAVICNNTATYYYASSKVAGRTDVSYAKYRSWWWGYYDVATNQIIILIGLLLLLLLLLLRDALAWTDFATGKWIGWRRRKNMWHIKGKWRGYELRRRFCNAHDQADLAQAWKISALIVRRR